ncbi:MAG: PLP-dependent aminotransferase family protein [Lachnospiraceae bacterium]|nr:PLP-dependent aminotransferase family protein [Lachnospiraceae bacterium]
MEKRGGLGKTEYLYRCIKEDVASGILFPDERLPSKRELAAHLDVSVVTVENAYAMLEEEGYIRGVARSGFYVNRLPVFEKARREGKKPSLLPEEEEEGENDGLRGGFFPAYARIIRRLLAEKPEILEAKPPNLGSPVLRNAIAGYLYRYRGMAVDAKRIIVGSGAEYLYGLIVQLFGRGILYGVEEPSYAKIRQVYEANGARVEGLPLGKDGIRREALAASAAGVLHVSPFYSFPDRVPVTARRRFEYISWANEKHACLVEDDFDSEFNSPRKPLETLYSMDRGGRVIYLNTFSKSIAPSMRVGYMILPEALMDRYMEKLGFYSCTVPVFDQYVLAEFINSGAFERHLSRKRRSGRTE